MSAERDDARREKAARAQARAAARRAQPLHDGESERRRLAARLAGFMIISGLVGVRTLCASVNLEFGDAGRDRWNVKIEFDGGADHFVDDPAVPAAFDAIYALRALAPRAGELILLGLDYSEALDQGNLATARLLADSYLKKRYAPPPSEAAEMLDIVVGQIFEEALSMLGGYRIELDRLLKTLIRKPRMSRSDCNSALCRVYEDFLRRRAAQLAAADVEIFRRRFS